ncbi:MAG TPA: FMN-binding protein [Acidimicrobiales bacterium]|nr:FMN-binding protein [Acidimicrobiales bacterium]
MRRAPIVLTSTAAGLALVLGFHTHAPHGIALGVTGTTGTTSTTGPTTTTAGSNTASTATTAPPTTSASNATRTATGTFVQYRYGDIQLRVTAQGSKIDKITVVQEDATDPRSEEINSQAIPMLQSQAMSAQSANIDGVSGATYTSEAYAQSLQAALDKLGIQ